MANKLYNDTSVKAIADAIRAKNGTTDTYTVGEMASAITNIPSGSGDISRVEWHQCPEAVRNYLDYVAEHPYTEDNPDVTYINNFAPATADVMTNTKPIAETVTGRGYRNEVPNVETPFSTATMAGTLKPLDHLRWINTTTIPPAQGESYPRGKNTRDLGGWACDGGTVKYGMLVRGSEPNPTDKELMIDEIGIKTEVQLLPISEQTDAYKMKSVWGIDWAGNDTNSSVYGLDNPTLLVKIIRDIINSVTHDKPVYFHCGVGADRTGWIAMVLEAVLGVSRCDIDIDYELTDFALGWQSLEGGIYRSRSYSTYQGLIRECYEVPLVGGLTSSFQNHIISYLIANGLTIDEINALRHACIDGTPEPITVSLNQYSVEQSGENVTFDNVVASVDEYQGYYVNLSAISGYVISDVSILMGGTTINAFRGKEVNLFRSITNNLSHCTTNNAKYNCIDGQSYGAIITADSGYTLEGGTISILVGGIEMAQLYYSNGAIIIPRVTENVVISVTAVKQGPAYTNLADKTGGDWKTNMRIRSIGELASSTNSDVTNCIEVSVGDVIRMKGVCGSQNGFTDFKNNMTAAIFADTSATTGTIFVKQKCLYDETNDVVSFTIPDGNSGKARFMLSHTYATDNIIITRNEEIT